LLAEHSKRGSVYDYNIPEKRAAESKQAEDA
jgi:hypothetical protein